MQLAFYIDISTGRLLSSLNTSTAVDPLTVPFFVGDEPLYQVYLMSPLQTTIASIPQYSIVSTAGLAFQMYMTNGKDVNAAGYVAYAWQISWSTDPNNSYFYAPFPLNAPGLVSLLGSNLTAPCTLVAGFITNATGLPTTVLSTGITVEPGLPQAIGPLPAGLTPLSVQSANQMFVPINGGLPGQGFTLVSANGNKIFVQAVDQPDGSGPAVLQGSPSS